MLYSKILQNFRNKIGLQLTIGNCALHVEKSIDSFLESGDIELIKKRIAYVLSQAGQFYPTFFSKKPKIKEEERKLKHFLRTGDLYQNPHIYKDLFGKNLNQMHAHEISHYVQSPQLEQLGGRFLLKTIVGIHTQQDLNNYVNFLFDIAKNTPHYFAISISNSNHIISLCYSKDDQCWHLINILSDPLIVESHESNKIQISQWIWDGLLEWTTGPQIYPFIGTTTRIYTTMNYASEMTQWVRTWESYSSYVLLINDNISHLERRTVNHFNIAHLAAMADDIDTLTNLHSFNPQILQPSDDLENSLINLAIHNGQRGILNYLFKLDSGFIKELFLTNNDGMTIFHVLAYYGYTDMLKFLFNVIDNIRIKPFHLKDNDGKTPLFLASEIGHADTIELILAYDVHSVNQPDAKGNTPLLIAAQNAHLNVVNKLIQKYDNNNHIICDVNHVNEDGESIAYICAQEGNIEILQMLLSITDKDNEIIIDLNKSDHDGRFPLLLTVSNDDVEMTKLLLRFANNNRKNNLDLRKEVPFFGGTVLHIAALDNHLKIAEMLIATMEKYGIDFFALNSNGETAQEVALNHSHFELAIKLSEAEQAQREEYLLHQRQM